MRREEDADFQLNQKHRSQTEERIAMVKRIVGSSLKNRDFESKQRYIGWAVLTHNLHLLAKMMAEAKQKKKDLATSAWAEIKSTYEPRKQPGKMNCALIHQRTTQNQRFRDFSGYQTEIF